MDSGSLQLFRLSQDYSRNPDAYRYEIDHYRVKGREFVSLTTALESGQSNQKIIHEAATSLGTDIDTLKRSIIKLLERYLSNTDHNHYQVLGLPNDVSDQLVREQYRRLISIFHPDKQSYDDSIALLINESYNVLKRPESRAEYDKSLNQRRPTTLKAENSYQYQAQKRSKPLGQAKKSFIEYFYFLPGFQAYSKAYIWLFVLAIAAGIVLLPNQYQRKFEPPSLAYQLPKAKSERPPVISTDGFQRNEDAEVATAMLPDTKQLDTYLNEAHKAAAAPVDNSPAIIDFEDKKEVKEKEKVPVVADKATKSLIAAHDQTEKTVMQSQADNAKPVDNEISITPAEANNASQGASQAPLVAIEEPAVLVTLPAISEAHTTLEKESVIQPDKTAKGIDTDEVKIAGVVTPVTKEESIVNILQGINFTGPPSSNTHSAPEIQEYASSQNMRPVAGRELPPEIIFMNYISQYEQGDYRSILRGITTNVSSRHGQGRVHIESAYRELFDSTYSRNIEISELKVNGLGAYGHLLTSNIVLRAQFTGEALPRQYSGKLILRISGSQQGQEITEINYDLR